MGGFPFALYVEFGVVGVLQVCCVGLPVGLSSYVLGESVYGCVQFGFGECRLEAEFEAIPEEVCCAWGWWDGCAEVVESTVGALVQAVELSQWHLL